MGTVIATDNFNRADTWPSGDLGANWTVMTAGLAIADNAVKSMPFFTQPNYGSLSFYNAVSAPNDHGSFVELVTVPGGPVMGPCVRCSGTNLATSNAYWAYILSDDRTIILKIINGSASVISSTVTPGWATNDIAGITAVGTLITIYKNGSFVVSGTDSDLATGQFGIGAYDQSNVLDNWSGTDEGSGGGSTFPGYQSPFGWKRNRQFDSPFKERLFREQIKHAHILKAA